VPNTRQRRETARRRLERQIQRRQEAQAQRRKRNLVTAAAFGVVLVIGAVFLLITQLGGDDDATPAAAEPTPAASASTSEEPATPGECTYTKSQEAASKDAGIPPNGTVPTTGTVTVDVATSQGPMTFTLDRAKAPCTVNNFAYLAGKKYFDGTSCHRVTTGENFGVLQCGDPTATGSGGPGYTFADEVSPDLKYTKGVLAMANSGPDTNGSQFFIVYKNTQLQPNYTVFGTVSKGIEVAEKVAAGGSDDSNGQGDGKPKSPIKLNTLTVGK
jgi:peptidyl-prolyl cis-trans isomerase B (cyclophilin B)